MRSVMRKDVANQITMLKELDLMNKSELARRLDCNRRTVKRYLNAQETTRTKRECVSILEDYKSTIIDKVDTYGSTSMAVFKFIEQKCYSGGYLTVNNFVKQHKNDEVKKATIRFETSPGLQAQVDWKEKLTIINKGGEPLEVNIFLMVLRYSRLKFIKLTDNRTQETLFECMFEAFRYFYGIPKEILFDNMATVVDRSSSTFKNVSLNKTFKAFSQDAGFEPITCRAYRPQTKGKVETLAKLMDRLKVYNEEFETFEDLEEIVTKFNEDINQEVSQATNERPFERFVKEKEYLTPLPPTECLLQYFYKEKEYKVTPESMIRYKGKKYSVPTRLIGNYLTVSETEDEIQIYYTQDLVACHEKSEKILNYKSEHAFEILKSAAIKDRSDEDINKFIENNLKSMDVFLS
jgi:transposase